MAGVSTRGPFLHLFDDAAIFPPANTPLPDALTAHRAHLTTDHADLVGPFLLSDRVLADLPTSQDTDETLGLGLVVTGGAGAIGPAITHASRNDGVLLQVVETAVRDEDDLARNAARITSMLELELPEDAIAYVELPQLRNEPPTASWWDAADAIAASGYLLKFRTGGEWADSHPTGAELSTFVAAALDRECAFKLTAGLHHAVRHTSPEGHERHGFLNVLLATQNLLAGADPAVAAQALARRDADGIATEISGWDDETVSRTRRWFRSLGTCSIDEPVTDLADLGLLA